MIVDDDTAVRVLLSAALERAGYRALVAGNGAEAIEVFERRGRDIDLVILDALMPVMDGKETYAALRALRSDVRVLFSTAYGEEVFADGGENSAPPILRKPYDLPTLLRAVRTVLDGPQA